jgi:hypothetical protein
LSLSLPLADWWSLLQHKVLEDPFYQKLLQHGSSSLNQSLQLRDDVWFKKGKIFLNPISPFISKVLAYGHSSPVGRHFGYHKTLAHIKHNFIWTGMRGMVKDYLKECDVCQKFKNDCMKPSGLLQPLPIPTRIWTDISKDFIEGLPSSNGYSVIMVAVDRLIKYAHFMALKHLFFFCIRG